jgi:putative phosphoesterase
MLLGVLADTHDHVSLIDRAIAVFTQRGVRAVIHAGDVVAPFAARRLLAYPGPLYIIYGNNDGEREGLRAVLPQIKDGPLKLLMGGRRILVHHFIDWCAPADIAATDVVITGHTHGVVNSRENGRLLLNPGECCGWVSGRPTVAVLNTNEPRAEVLELR